MDRKARLAAVATVALLCGCVSVVDQSVETRETQKKWLERH